MKLVLTQKAKEDLLSIGHYTEKLWGKQQRNTYLKQLDICLKKLIQAPLIGRPCDYIRPAYRKHSYGKHMIFYIFKEDKLTIIRILHQSMDYNKEL